MKILMVFSNRMSCTLRQVEFDADGKAYGVTSEGETAKCKKLVCDPSYLPDKVNIFELVCVCVCVCFLKTRFKL